jgi:hypothetical protein
MDVRASDVEEFIALAGEAWSDPDAAAYPLRQPCRLGASRIATQPEWEAAGRPAAATRQALSKRQALTLDSVPASTLLVAP